MTKFRLYFNKDKETMWLNEMAKEGCAMMGFFAGFYAFEKCEPGEYIYQIDFSQEFGRVHSAYREFMKETGAEIMGVWGYWVFLRRKAAEGVFELYTDVESMITHYSRIRRMFRVGLGAELCCLIMEACCAVNGIFAGKLTFILILLFVFAFAREITRLDDLLAELKSRLGEYDTRGAGGRQRLSKILLTGIFINGIALIIDNPAYETWRHGLILAGLLLMGAGIALTFLNSDS